MYNISQNMNGNMDVLFLGIEVISGLNNSLLLHPELVIKLLSFSSIDIVHYFLLYWLTCVLEHRCIQVLFLWVLCFSWTCELYVFYEIYWSFLDV